MPVKHSLWLVPPGDAYARLEGLVLGLAAEHGTPAFRPHITLLGGLAARPDDIMAKAAPLASAIRPFRVGFAGIGHRDEYYRCLFLAARQCGELIEANALARRAFGREGDSPFMPHLSLMYCEFSSRYKREFIIPAIDRKILDMTFEVDSICLYATEGEPHEWQEVARLSLGSL